MPSTTQTSKQALNTSLRTALLISVGCLFASLAQADVRWSINANIGYPQVYAQPVYSQTYAAYSTYVSPPVVYYSVPVAPVIAYPAIPVYQAAPVYVAPTITYIETRPRQYWPNANDRFYHGGWHNDHRYNNYRNNDHRNSGGNNYRSNNDPPIIYQTSPGTQQRWTPAAPSRGYAR